MRRICPQNARRTTQIGWRLQQREQRRKGNSSELKDTSGRQGEIIRLSESFPIVDLKDIMAKSIDYTQLDHVEVKVEGEENKRRV